MKCKKCKKEIPDGAAFCPWCGAKQAKGTGGRKPKSRGNGTGSVFQDPKKKTWAAVRVIDWSVDEQGRVHKKTRGRYGFATKREAIEALATIGTEKQETAETFAQVFAAWAETYRGGDSAVAGYRAAYKHFAPVYRKKLREITVDDLQDCLNACPRGRRTQENMRTLCGMLYKYAIPRHIAGLDMSKYLTIHAHGHGEKLPLPDSALVKLKASAGIVPGADIVLCHCYLGFRPSELLALTADSYIPEEKAFRGGAKTEAGRNRVVTVPPVIQGHVDQLLYGKTGKAPVFCRADGKKLSEEAYRSLFYRTLEACGIENPEYTDGNGARRKTYTPHSCRHTYAMLTAKANGSASAVKRLMGHSSIEMTEHYRNGEDFAELRKVTDSLQ